MTASLAGLTALAIVTLMLLATIARQWGLPGRLATLDLLAIVPGWAFFVRTTGEYDLAIEVRGQRGDGGFDAWQELAAAHPRRPWQWLWYPEAYPDAILGQMIDRLDRRIAAGRPADASSSLAYAGLLDIARARTADAGYAAVQFALVRRTLGERTVTFTSAVHPC